MSLTSTKRSCRLAKHIQMAKSLDAEARMEEARGHLQECQMKHTDVDYREFNYFNTELTIVVNNFQEKGKRPNKK